MNNSPVIGARHVHVDPRNAFKSWYSIALPQKRTKVLVIDDDMLLRRMLCLVLKSRGYVTIDADNGALGMQMFRTEKPDLVITDILMPDQEGFETIKEIRNADANIPIIAMSGGGDVQGLSFLTMAKKLGASRTISKPFTPENLEEVLSSLTLGHCIDEYALTLPS